MFCSTQKEDFFILFFSPCFIGKNLQQCNFNFAKTHFGREMGEQKADMKCCLLAVAHGMCSPLRGRGSSLPRLVQCRTRSECCTVSPVPTHPSQCPCCVGDTPSGCRQSFCSRVQLGSLVFVCLKHVLLAWPQPRQWLYDYAILVAVYHSTTSVSSASSVGDDFMLEDGEMSVLGVWD